MNRTRLRNSLLLALVGVGMTFMASRFVSTEAERYVTVNPSITQRFASVPNESKVAEFCYRLRSLEGVTGVSYRDYDPVNRTATITIFYNPRATTVRNIRIFLLHGDVLWKRPLSA